MKIRNSENPTTMKSVGLILLLVEVAPEKTEELLHLAQLVLLLRRT